MKRVLSLMALVAICWMAVLARPPAINESITITEQFVPVVDEAMPLFAPATWIDEIKAQLILYEDAVMCPLRRDLDQSLSLREAMRTNTPMLPTARSVCYNRNVMVDKDETARTDKEDVLYVFRC